MKDVIGKNIKILETAFTDMKVMMWCRMCQPFPI